MKFHRNLVGSAHAEHRIVTISDSMARIGPLKSPLINSEYACGHEKLKILWQGLKFKPWTPKNDFQSIQAERDSLNSLFLETTRTFCRLTV